MVKVFVTDAEHGRIPLNIIRSLGRKGIKCYLGGCLKIATPYYSRYCTKKVIYPSPVSKPAEFKTFMFELIKKEKFDVVFPVMNDTVLFFSKYKDELSQYTKIPLVEYDKMILAMNKANTLKLAEKLNIPVPKTYYPEDIKELKEILTELTFPIILKAKNSFGSQGVRLCHSKKKLIWSFMALSKTYGAPLVQEYIPDGGEAIGVSCLFDYQHQEKAVFSHRRLRQYPIRGGPSTLRESIKHPQAEALALKLLHKIGWFGVAMVEFKVDPRDNQPKLMEINPRFWGSLSLALFAGMDFPYLLYQLVTKGKVKRIKNYKVGIRSRWLGGDFLYLLNTKHKLKFLSEFFNFSDENTFTEDFARDDPLPFFSRPLSFIYLFDRKIREKIFRYS